MVTNAATFETSDTPSEARADPKAYLRRIQALTKRDNVTNWYFLLRIWVVVAAATAAAYWAHVEIYSSGIGWGWHIPVALLGIAIIGACQHQLGGVLHEGTHHMLFANRHLNELVCDWMAAFPMYTSIYHYRLYHLAHHQFINDPERDPDLAQLKASGHWFDFPVTHMEILYKILKQLWLPNLFRYTIARAKSHSHEAASNPYADPDHAGSQWPNRMSLLFWILPPAVMFYPASMGNMAFTMGLLVAVWAVFVLYFLLIPDAHFPKSRINPVISHRVTAISRVTFLALLYGVLVAIDVMNGHKTISNMFGVYWLIPLFTTFPLFMILRHWVHHGNADRGRYTNSRIFLVNPIVRFAIFPFGFDYHLPHHVFSSVPHYKLKELHEILLENDKQYREKGVIVEGYFGLDNPLTGRPTALSVLGPEHAPKMREDIYIDDTVLVEGDVADAEGIEREVQISVGEDSGA